MHVIDERWHHAWTEHVAVKLLMKDWNAIENEKPGLHAITEPIFVIFATLLRFMLLYYVRKVLQYDNA